jgi:OOP family OmpA-OmpF porin
MMRTTKPRILAVWAIATGLALLLAACGGSGSTHTKTSTGTTSTGTGTTATSTSTTTAAPTPAASQTFSFPSASGPQPTQLEVLDIHRVGAYVQLDLAVTCELTSGTCSDDLSPEPDAGPQAGTGTSEPDDSGVYLIDPVNERAYYAVRDRQSAGYASQADDAAGQTDLEWVRYPAPPASVTSLDVAVPQGPIFTGVPVTAGTTPPVPANWTVEPILANFQAPASDTDTTGLTLPDDALKLDVGNPTGSDTNEGDTTELTLSSDVLFAFGRATLTAKARAIIAAAAAEIRRRATGIVAVKGYTDSIGSEAVNLPLSVHRAQSVVKALTSLTPEIHYRASGYGPADPIAPNTYPNGQDDPAGRALNRRVTITFNATKPQAPTPPPASGASSGAAATTTGQTLSFPAGQSKGTPPDGHWRATVESLARDGNLAVLQMQVTCLTPGGCGSYDLSGSATVPPQNPEGGTTERPYTVSGFSLQDSAGTEYIPVRDAVGNPIVSALNSTYGYGRPTTVWVYYPAPPADLSQIKVLAPLGVSAVEVPISGG